MVVESQAVDQRVSGREAEHPGLGVTGLRLWGHGANLNEAKSHVGKRIDAPRLFVEASGQADAVGKLQTGNRDWVGNTGLPIRQAKWRMLRRGQACKGEIVSGFCIKAKQSRTGDGVGQQGHKIIEVLTVLIVPDTYPVSPMTQDELKTLVGQAALAYVRPNTIVGVGTGSTVNKFIDALASIKDQIKGAVSSSEASTVRLKALGIPVFDSNDVSELSVYIDGADEINSLGHMVKGGGAALTREKIVAAQSKMFVCIADESKLVDVLGAFPLPVEVIPMASSRIMAQFAAMGGQAQVRMKDGAPLVTDNGQHIIDVKGLKINDPMTFETQVSQWPGVVTVGVFAHQKAQVCLLGTTDGVKTLKF